jgi:ATP-binding cassette subfamily B (MDR/TAP) protein 1
LNRRSTVISLLERFYDPLSGRITLDGHDVAALNVAAYRSRIALVAQESALYAGSVRTNVLLGSDRPEGEVTQADIEAACKAAKCVRAVREAILRAETRSHSIHDFVMQLPQGYDTELGGKGAQLSGGQRCVVLSPLQ